MFRLISKRELLLYHAQIQDLRKEIQDLRELVKHERARAEGAINALLIRKIGLAVTPDAGPTIAQQEELREKQFDLFGDGANYTEDEALEKLQS